MIAPTDFMNAVWGGLHSLASDRGRFSTVGVFDDVDDLLDAAQAENRQGANVWFGAHALPCRPAKGRGTNADIEKVRVLVADLDWFDPANRDAHASKDLPTEAEVRSALAKLTVAPHSALVNSGHGLQPYWILTNSVDAAEGHELTLRLHAAIEALGIPADRSDLASVLRVPGMFSFKPGCQPVEVVVEELHVDRLHVPEYLAKHLPGAGARRRSSGGGGGGVTDRGYADVLAKLRADGREQDADALELMCTKFGGHHPYLTGKGHIEVTRPGKPAGCSATIGYVGPGVIKMMTSGWAHGGFAFDEGGRYTLDGAGGFVSDAEDRAREHGPVEGGGAGGKKPSARDALIALTLEAYELGRTEDERLFLVPHDGPNIALFSGSAKADLARRYRARANTSVGRTPLDEAWTTLEGFGLDVPKSPLPLRMATHEGHLVVDIGDVDGHAAIVTPSGWTVVERSPVTFRRSKAMLPLSMPARGGTVDELFALLNVAPRSRDLFAAWMTSAFFEALPHPAPVFSGEQGVAKSTTARAVSRLIDPCMADTSKPPKTDDDWSHTCSARWIVAVDNVSSVPEWWSDALCRTVTGDGWLRRKLYEDDDVVVTKWRRCVILNGISLGASLRPDLAERLVFFALERPAEYLTEAEVNARLDDMAPRVLGALLDRCAATLAHLPITEPVRDLRMADFAHLLAAHDAGCGTKALDAYRLELDEAFEEALAGDPLATAVVDFMTGRDEWTGTSAELLRALAMLRPDGEGFWPKTAHHLSQTMTRSAASLRRVGIVWHKPVTTGRDNRRVARLTRALASAASASTLIAVFDKEEKGEHGPEARTQQWEPERSQRSQALGDLCPLCNGSGYDRSTGSCASTGCSGF